MKNITLIVHMTNTLGERNTWESFLYPTNFIDTLKTKKILRWTRSDGRHQGKITSYAHRYDLNTLHLHVTQEF